MLSSGTYERLIAYADCLPDKNQRETLIDLFTSCVIADTVDKFETIKKQLYKEKESHPDISEAIDQALEILSYRLPINTEDVVTQESIPSERKLMLTSGHSIDMISLLQGLQRGDKKNYYTNIDYSKKEFDSLVASLVSASYAQKIPRKNSFLEWQVDMLAMLAKKDPALCFMFAFTLVLASSIQHPAFFLALLTTAYLVAHNLFSGSDFRDSTHDPRNRS